MPPRKKLSKEAIEQKSYLTFNPEDVKQTVEVAVKPKPSISEIETIEKREEPINIKSNSAIKKIRKTKTKSSSSKFKKSSIS